MRASNVNSSWDENFLKKQKFWWSESRPMHLRQNLMQNVIGVVISWKRLAFPSPIQTWCKLKEVYMAIGTTYVMPSEEQEDEL